MKEKPLFSREFVFMNIVWENEPLSSRALADKSADALGWKRTTAYTVLKKLSDKGYLINENGTIHSRISRDEALMIEYKENIAPLFGDSVSELLSVALSGKNLSDKEARALKHVIDAHRDKKEK